jgi:tetratricopeptide (TPR) repeat protein
MTDLVQSTTPTEGAADATAVDDGTTRPGAERMSPTELGVARAAAMFERVDPAKAAALLENVLKLDPESAAGWILMARIRLVLDQVDEALDAAAKAIELAPEDPRPLATASRALTLKGRHEEAVTIAYRAVIAEPRNPLWQDRVAWALLAADRQLADAEQAAGTAISLDPNEAHYYFTQGVTLDALGHADQARQALLISLRLEPDNPVAPAPAGRAERRDRAHGRADEAPLAAVRAQECGLVPLEPPGGIPVGRLPPVRARRRHLTFPLALHVSKEYLLVNNKF